LISHTREFGEFHSISSPLLTVDMAKANSDSKPSSASRLKGKKPLSDPASTKKRSSVSKKSSTKPSRTAVSGNGKNKTLSKEPEEKDDQDEDEEVGQETGAAEEADEEEEEEEIDFLKGFESGSDQDSSDEDLEEDGEDEEDEEISIAPPTVTKDDPNVKKRLDKAKKAPVCTV
jgi:hypothetical protein